MLQKEKKEAYGHTILWFNIKKERAHNKEGLDKTYRPVRSDEIQAIDCRLHTLDGEPDLIYILVSWRGSLTTDRIPDRS